MTIILIMVISGGVFLLAGRFYSRFLARSVGEDPSRPTPAVVMNDGRDYVPSPTPVVFAHHFASIAGAGPIIGPVIAIVYGWVPALLWVVIGGVTIGAVHDYLATYMTTREGGQSVATIARRLVGRGAFVALMLFLVVMLALVCAMFLNLSAIALTSKLPFDRVDLPPDQTLFRVEETAAGKQVVIGGIASMSVIVITAVGPLLGWMYIKKKVAVWKCSLMAIGICAVSVTIGIFRPVAFPDTVSVFGWFTLTGPDIWRLLLSGYVLVAAGLPVWLFLQSRDFINVHILYVGMAALLVTLLVAGARGGWPDDRIPATNIAQGTRALGMFWPVLFITIACGAVSGFHSLCAGGTTCKQLTSERAARHIGYSGMLLESFLAVCVIAVLMIGAGKSHYLLDVHPKLFGLTQRSNPVLGFAVAVGAAGKAAFGAPLAVGTLAGMILLEGFLVTTLDTAIRLARYLLEEIWRALLGAYDIFAAPVVAREAKQQWTTGERVPAGSDGIPVAPALEDSAPAPALSARTHGIFRLLLRLLRQYWFNSALAVAMMLAFACTGGLNALWGMFATSNQLLAAMVLSLAALWLLRRKKKAWFAFVPALFMLATTAANLVLLLVKFLAEPAKNATLLAADIVIIILAGFLFLAGARAAARYFRGQPPPAPVAPDRP